MKSIALTLAVLFGTLSFAQATDSNSPATTQDDVAAVEDVSGGDANTSPDSTNATGNSEKSAN